MRDVKDRESLIRLIERETGWSWCDSGRWADMPHFFDAEAGEYGRIVGLDPEHLDAIVRWANEGQGDAPAERSE